MLDNTPNQRSKFKTKNWVEINDESQGLYNEFNQTRFKTSMLWLSLCDYSNVYILVKAADTAKNAANKKVIFNNCVPFINCISRINNN